MFRCTACGLRLSALQSVVTHRCSCRSKYDCSIYGMRTHLVARMKRIITWLQPRRQPDGRHELVPISKSFVKNVISSFGAVQCSARFSHNVFHSYGLHHELLGKSHEAKRTERFLYILKVSPLSRATQEPSKRKKKEKNNKVKKKGIPVKWALFSLHPHTLLSLISGLLAANVSWKRSMGGSHRAGGGPEL